MGGPPLGDPPVVSGTHPSPSRERETMHRPSLRAVLTTVAAAAVLVGGADLTAYAATGNAFILGHSNSAGGTTSLKNTGRGPALSLNNIKSAPPLVVNSRKVVKNLNADTVDG